MTKERKLILIEENQDFEKIYKINFNAYLGMDVMSFQSSAEAIRAIDGRAGDIIVCRANIGKENTAEQVYEYLQGGSYKIPMITLGEMDQSVGDTTIVSSGVGLKSLIQTSAKKLGITAKDMVSFKVPEYYPFDIDLFEKIEHSPLKIFRKLESGQFEDTLLHEDFSLEAILKLKDQNTQDLFVLKNERLKMTEIMTEHLVSSLDVIGLNGQEKIDYSEQSMHLLSSKLINVGVSKQAALLAAQTLKGTVHIAKKTKGLKSLLKKLMQNKHSYCYLHAQLITFFGVQLMQILDWGTPDQEKKFSFVALFHDILLIDDELAKIHSKEQLRDADLAPEIKGLVECHAQMACELITKFPSAPLTTDVIIRQHHGTLNGKGFMTHASGNLTQLATLFMVVEYFVELSLDVHTQPDFQDIIEKVRERFNTSRFKPIIEALIKIISK